MDPNARERGHESRKGKKEFRASASLEEKRVGKPEGPKNGKVIHKIKKLRPEEKVTHVPEKEKPQMIKSAYSTKDREEGKKFSGIRSAG